MPRGFDALRESPSQLRGPATVRGIDASERRRLVDWLDDRLREGQRGRLESEYPISLNDDTWASHRVVHQDGKPAAHAMFHVATLRTPEPLCVGMIGLVFTEPAARQRGLARRCIEACVDELAARGAALVLLWSDAPEFYARLGFAPFGVEVRYAIDAQLCRRARSQLPLKGRDGRSNELCIDEARFRDWAPLERLYAAKTICAVRSPGALRRLAAAPDTHLLVARRGTRAVAYTALGRGDDFCGVAHEWAGSPAGVLACLETLCEAHGPLQWFRGPSPGAIDSALELAGAQAAEAPFALARVLDLSVEIPASLYLWGFDSI